MIFILQILATWRLAHLFNKEVGPYKIILRIRMKMGNNIFGELMDCFNCLSIWCALLITDYQNLSHYLISALALSGAAIIIQHWIGD